MRVSTKKTPAKRGRKPKIALTQDSTLSVPKDYSVVLSESLYEKLTSFAASRGIDLESLIRVATTNVMRASRYYDLDTILVFGKYSGETLETIVRLDPKYVAWAMENITGLCISENAQTLLDHMLTHLNVIDR